MRTGLIVAALAAALAGQVSSVVWAAPVETVKTPIGDVKLQFGLPANADEERRLYDQMDFQRATQCYIWAIPFVAMAEWKYAHLNEIGAAENETVLYAEFKDKMGILTPNMTTPYLITFGNLAKGPVVVELPAANMGGMVMDFWQRPMTDLGQVGPDKGKGGKFLLIGPGQAPPADTAGYFVVPVTTNNFFAGVRVLDPGPENVAVAQKGFRIYPYAQRDNPPKQLSRSAGGKKWSQVQPRGMAYWERFDEYMQQEPIDARDRMMMAMLAPLGIEKGKSFKPDERSTKLLTDGAVMGELMSMNISFAKRFPDSYYRDDAKWAYVLMFDPSQERPNYTELDERTDYFYEAVTASGGMVSTTPGVGSAYLGAYKDKDNNWFDGSKTYRLRVPSGPPAKNFWSLTIYDTYDRIPLDNRTQVSDISSRKETLKKNADGTVDLYVGPKAPAGFENNWIETLPDKAWFAYFRFYGPEQAYFDRSWKLPDFELVE
ncbi:DUF1254 domain-containing protein [Nordella sp. HKS 07]|uniref:DUF1254 domain-containing protein n=1 Tax=Nordella sp. HKS 07 TaxID=2712222 RepID=UPI0013E1B285|nr:DUF1254 domain-containing protein [Nordella sp. HKS 07]QIG51010.1 DUF1254 domain-containing protein [Nordella sp. HKS 07]